MLADLLGSQTLIHCFVSLIGSYKGLTRNIPTDRRDPDQARLLFLGLPLRRAERWENSARLMVPVRDRERQRLYVVSTPRHDHNSLCC